MRAVPDEEPTHRAPDVVLVERDGAVARLTINRPERRNALSSEVIGKLRARLAEIREDSSVRVVVLTGTGDKAFSAGADLVGPSSPAASAAASPGSEGPDALALHDVRGELAQLMQDLWDLGKPTVARVRGYALAGGMGLALSCDLLVASDDAIFGTPEIDIGIWPFMITVPLLRSLAPRRALELMLTGRRVGAAEGERLGFVNRVVPADELDRVVDELTATLAQKPPGAMRLGRGSFYEALDMSSSEALAYLHSLLSVATSTAEAAEGRLAFAEKRRPGWVH